MGIREFLVVGIKSNEVSIIPSLILQSMMGARDYLAQESHDCRDFPNIKVINERT